jgi:N-methylhydantoinase A/oxoprolinase/acetone carboxylase beta subunit
VAAQARQPVEAFCQDVVAGVSQRAAKALVTKALHDEAALPGSMPQWDQEPTAALLLTRALDGDRAGRPVAELDLDFSLTLRRPVVAIGAPVEAYMPRVAERLHTQLLIPPHAEVANAVGAVAGGVVQRQRVLITPLEAEKGSSGWGGSAVRVHLPEGPRDFGDLEQAVAYASQVMRGWMENLARQAGAAQVEVQMVREDRDVMVKAGWGDRLYLGTDLTFTAVGRPSPAVQEA